MIWNMAIFAAGTSLPLRAQSHARICAPVLIGDAPDNPRVWAHHSPPPKRNLRKAWFFEVVFFSPTQFYWISTQFYWLNSILLDSDSILLDSDSILLDFDSILLNCTAIPDPTYESATSLLYTARSKR